MAGRDDGGTARAPERSPPTAPRRSGPEPGPGEGEAVTTLEPGRLQRRIAHISDLHFGKEDPEVVVGLMEDLRQRRADLVLVSGDLTQRALRLEFVAAGEYLRNLGIPWMAVPGNHDLPLHARRVLRPFGDYRRHIHPDLMPRYMDDDVAVLGLTTASPLIWTQGFVTPRMLRVLRAWAAEAGDRLRIVIAHHPFSRPDEGGHPLVVNWRAAVRTMEMSGVDIVLTGHHHISGRSESRAYAVDGPRRLVVVGAGTSTSVRQRGELNSYNLLHYNGHRVYVERRLWHEDRFVSAGLQRFTRLPHNGVADRRRSRPVRIRPPRRPAIRA